MVNLKEYYIKISNKKEDILLNLEKILNFVKKEEKYNKKRIYK